MTIVVKGAKVRVKVLKMRFRCDDASRRTPVRVSTRFVPVKPGAAGGGAMIELDRRVRVHDESLRLDGTVFLGLRATSVSGTADAYLLDDRGSAVCEDAAIFTAR